MFLSVPNVETPSRPESGPSRFAPSLTLAAMSLGYGVVQLDVTIVNLVGSANRRRTVKRLRFAEIFSPVLIWVPGLSGKVRNFEPASDAFSPAKVFVHHSRNRAAAVTLNIRMRMLLRAVGGPLCIKS